LSSLVIAQLPQLTRRIPFAASLFDAALQRGFLEFNAQPTMAGFSGGDQPDSATMISTVVKRSRRCWS
jgi:hypothetical protein